MAFCPDKLRWMTCWFSGGGWNEAGRRTVPECVPAGQKRLPGVRGAQQGVPGVQPGGARKENREAERFGKAGQLNGAGLTPPHHGAQRFKAAGRFEPGAPCAGLRAYEEAAVRWMRNKGKIKSISADSGVGNKGVKADPRRAAKAAGFTILHLPPPGGIRAGRPQPQAAGAVRCEYCAPSGRTSARGLHVGREARDLLQ